MNTGSLDCGVPIIKCRFCDFHPQHLNLKGLAVPNMKCHSHFVANMDCCED